MKKSRPITWARLRVYFGILLIVLFALGGFVAYASFLADPQSGHTRSNLRILAAELIALSVFATVLAKVLKKRLAEDD